MTKELITKRLAKFVDALLDALSVRQIIFYRSQIKRELLSRSGSVGPTLQQIGWYYSVLILPALALKFYFININRQWKKIFFKDFRIYYWLFGIIVTELSTQMTLSRKIIPILKKNEKKTLIYRFSWKLKTLL